MFAPQDQDKGRAEARDLTRNRSRALARRLRRAALGAVCAIAFLLPLQFVGAGAAQASMTFVPLTLVNGWTPAELSTPAVGDINGIVHLTGSIEHGTSPVAFTLPAGFRPATEVYVPVDMCNTAKGRLDIAPSGVVSVQAEGPFSDAQCFTSLDGASFALPASSFTPLTPVNGWTNAPYGTSSAGAADIDGIVHLKGAIASGTSPVAFTLPAGFRPATNVYVPVDMCNATNGRLDIAPSGVVSVQAEGGAFSDAQCFTSLDGASFATSASSFTPLSLVNLWTNAPYGTSDAAAANINGIVYLKGAIATPGTEPTAFNLPAGMRPSIWVYVPVDLCGATYGHLYIEPNGDVTVAPEGGPWSPNWSDVQCFTSLDGVSFAL